MGAIIDLDCNGHWPGGKNIKQRMSLLFVYTQNHMDPAKNPVPFQVAGNNWPWLPSNIRQLGGAPPATCCSSVVKVNAISQEWSRKYGMISGVVISDPDMIKEVLVNNNIAGSFEKLALNP
ncbi:hypothetical protein POTOM_028053 [Populus tomentosa]|uniref:Uncharacterized protein n=1 Tax=Populus tomentosa TaxID=118781 RepID=A0A8X7ZFV4_POPTO|nr:hypothetical protein POTOM_028053 [Populus tomentosa]